MATGISASHRLVYSQYAAVTRRRVHPFATAPAGRSKRLGQPPAARFQFVLFARGRRSSIRDGLSHGERSAAGYRVKLPVADAAGQHRRPLDRVHSWTRALPRPAAHGLQVQQMMEALLQSAATGREVTRPETTRPGRRR